MREELINIVKKRASDTGFQKYERALKSNSAQDLAMAWVAVPRWIEAGLLEADAQELSILSDSAKDINWRLWTAVDFARCLIFLRGLDLNPEFFDDISQYFDHGETVACCRALSLAARPERFEAFARECCRSNSEEVFGAMAIGNPYPAQFFEDDAFNQMVIKALFLNTGLMGIAGLGQRITDETRRMAGDYAAELKAAGRPLPEDIDMVLPRQTSENSQ